MLVVYCCHYCLNPNKAHAFFFKEANPLAYQSLFGVRSLSNFDVSNMFTRKIAKCFSKISKLLYEATRYFQGYVW